MSEFATYEEARMEAEARVRKTRVPVGIEKPTRFQGWTVKFLPKKENRYGWETRCEALEPEDYR